MKTWKKVLCLILALLLFALAGLIFWQRDNVGAMILYLKADSDEITSQKEQLDQDHKETLEDASGVEIQVNLPSTEACDGLLNGSISAEQVKEYLGLTAPLEHDKTLNGIVNACAAELASCKVDVMAKLGTLKSETLDAWAALDPEARTTQKKAAMVTAGLKECYAYEVEVDKAVEACLDRYRAELEAIGEDPSVIDIFWQQYCEEKQTEKAFYLEKYLN